MGKLVHALFVYLCLCLASAQAATSSYEGTVYFQGGQYVLKVGVVDKAGAAYASFADTLNETGWGVLDVGTNSSYADSVQMFAAGMVEGALTQERIYENVLNTHAFFWPAPSAPSNKLVAFLDDQHTWTMAQVAANPNSPLWQQVSLIQNQFDGLVAGYAARCLQTQCTKNLTLFDFRMLQATGDLLDLISALHDNKRPNWMNMTQQQFAAEVFKRSMCSGFIKVTDDLSDLFAAHSSWFTYGAMNRIYKNYFFDLSASFVKAKRMTFSSYPGFLESLDDFYQMDSGLVMVQTTNGIYNHSLYDLVKPQSLLAWQRVRVANSMASSGQEWYEYLSQHNSGTYNNQYMVVDYKLFSPGQPLVPNTLWVVEQIPGLVVGSCLTLQLERGYFPSYNIPNFAQIYDRSGYPSIVKKFGVRQSYDLAPRAQIFRRDQGKVSDITSLKSLMRYNNYKEDPISKGDPTAAIVRETARSGSGSRANSLMC